MNNILKGRAVISLGSNLPNGREIVQQAIEMLRQRLSNLKVSDIYTTRPFSGEGPDYTNAVVVAISDDDEVMLNKYFKELEQAAGRTHNEGDHTVALDLDLVIWEGRIVRPSDFERPYFNIGYRQLLASGAMQTEV